MTSRLKALAVVCAVVVSGALIHKVIGPSVNHFVDRATNEPLNDSSNISLCQSIDDEEQKRQRQEGQHAAYETISKRKLTTIV
jgi:hypothetical protein